MDLQQAIVKRTVKALNASVVGTPLEAATLPKVIEESRRAGVGASGILRLAESLAGHTFFFDCLTDEPARRSPSAAVEAAASLHFGSLAEMRERMFATALAIHGSGSVWLIAEQGQLDIVAKFNADTALHHEGIFPLLALDAWEHSFVVDFGADKEAYLAAWWDAIDWVKVDARLTEALEAAGVAR
jgi:Fe-Mn family superoxide dismutase